MKPRLPSSFFEENPEMRLGKAKGANDLALFSGSSAPELQRQGELEPSSFLCEHDVIG